MWSQSRKIISGKNESFCKLHRFSCESVFFKYSEMVQLTERVNLICNFFSRSTLGNLNKIISLNREPLLKGKTSTIDLPVLTFG